MRTNLTETQYLILAAVATQPGKAYGVSIKDAVLWAVGRELNYGPIYVTLDAFEKEGLVIGEWSEATPQRGGRRKKLYTLTQAGEVMLREALEHRRKIMRLAVMAQSEENREKLRAIIQDG